MHRALTFVCLLVLSLTQSCLSLRVNATNATSTSTRFGPYHFSSSPSQSQPSGGISTTHFAGNKTSTVTTGSGLSYARSCATALSDYLSSSAFWSLDNLGLVNTTVTSTVPHRNQVVPIYDASRTTKLCDGHPRIIGPATTLPNNSTISQAAFVTTVTTALSSRSYPSPKPTCSINKMDCEALYSSSNGLVVPEYGTPLCDYSGSTSSYSYSVEFYTAVGPSAFGSESTSSASISGTISALPSSDGFYTAATSPQAFGGFNPSSLSCQQCTIVAEAAQLLYWPVRTRPGSDNLCSGNVSFSAFEVLTGTPTGSGPNTYVTQGVTITSPSVAISLTGISRKDGCYTTVASTIIPVDAEVIQSIRGYNPVSSVYRYWPFNFADLNYECQGTNGSLYVADDSGPNCYPVVPADAYFSGSSAWAWASSLPQSIMATVTIGDNYRPDILLPAELERWAERLWNQTCILSSCGVWDPPTALQSATAEIMPSVLTPKTTSAHATTTTPATPAQPVSQQASQTSTARHQDNPGATSQKASADPATQASSPGSAGSAAPTTGNSAGQGDPGSGSGVSDQPQTAEGPSNVDSSATTVDPSTQSPFSAQPQSSAGDPNSNAQDPQSTSALVSTDSTSRQARPVLGGQASSSEPVSSNDGDSGVSAATTSSCGVACYVLSALGGSPTVASAAQTSASNGQDPAIPSSQATGVSGSDPQDPSDPQVTAGSTQNPPATPAAGSESAFSVGSQGFTAISAGPSSVIVENAQSTATLALGGSAVTVGSQIVSAESTGNLIFGTGAEATTVISLQPNDPAESVFTIGSEVYTQSAEGSRSVVIANGHTTATIIANGAAITLGSQVASANPSGDLVFGTGAQKTTVTGQLTEDGDTSVFPFGSQTYTEVRDGPSSVIIENGQTAATLAFTGPAVTIGSQVVSADSIGNIIVGTGSDRSTITGSPALPSVAQAVRFGSADLTVSSLPDGGYLVQNGQSSVTLSTGGEPKAIDGEVISACSTGIVIESGSAKTTVNVGMQGVVVGPASVLTSLEIGTQDYSVIQLSSNVYALEDGTTTRTIAVGDAPLTMGSEIFSAGSMGLDMQSGTILETISAAGTATGGGPLDGTYSTATPSSSLAAMTAASQPTSTSAADSARRTPRRRLLLSVALLLIVVLLLAI